MPNNSPIQGHRKSIEKRYVHRTKQPYLCNGWTDDH